jgi:hypothetical protein
MLLELALSSSFRLLQYQHLGTANQLLYRVQGGYAWPCKAPCDGTGPIRYQVNSLSPGSTRTDMMRKWSKPSPPSWSNSTKSLCLGVWVSQRSLNPLFFISLLALGKLDKTYWSMEAWALGSTEAIGRREESGDEDFSVKDQFFTVIWFTILKFGILRSITLDYEGHVTSLISKISRLIKSLQAVTHIVG